MNGAAALTLAACLGGNIELQPGSTIDYGWTGIAHNQQMTSGATMSFIVLSRCTDDDTPCSTNADCANDECVATCDCDGDPTCEISGPVQQRHCLRSLADCDDNSECPVGQPCVAQFGPPIPFSSGGTPICVVGHFTSPISGTLDVATGEMSLDASLLWRVSLGIQLDKPCPRCGPPEEDPAIGEEFTCEGGPSDGDACRVDGVTEIFGGTSFDCPPSVSDAIFSPGLTIRLNELTTGTTTRTAGIPCANPAFKANNPLTPGSTPRCIDKIAPTDPTCATNADCTRCNGDATISCTTNDDCSGNGSCTEAPDQPVTCGYWCNCGFCGDDPNLPCIQNSDCPAEKPTCVAGTGGVQAPNSAQQKPNDCSKDKNICGTLEEEKCATTTRGECSEQPYRTCTQGSQTCQDNKAGDCVITPRPCFESRITRTGQPSPTAPTLAGLACIPSTAQTSINNVAGITGPAALSWKTSLGICRCTEPDPACTDVCSHVPACGNDVVDSGEDCDGGVCCKPDCTFHAAATVCRPTNNACDPAEHCSGSSATCPANAKLPDGTACVDANQCTAPDVCSGGRCTGGPYVDCGNGEIDGNCNETCDDGNTADGDGCSTGCRLQQLCGDANDDGSIKTSDAQRVLQRAVGLDVDCPQSVCDVDSSGSVGTADALRVLRKAVELPGALDCDYA